MRKHWQAKLKPYLTNPKAKIAFIGIGNTMLGDDAAGILLAQRLAAVLSKERFCVLEGGLAPENVVGALRSFCPQLVILLDIVLGIGQAGTIHCLEPNKIAGFTASSHSLPLSMLAAYLQAEYACPVYVLAMTAQSLAPDAPLSPSVAQAVTVIFSYLTLTTACV